MLPNPQRRSQTYKNRLQPSQQDQINVFIPPSPSAIALWTCRQNVFLLITDQEHFVQILRLKKEIPPTHQVAWQSALHKYLDLVVETLPPPLYELPGCDVGVALGYYQQPNL